MDKPPRRRLQMHLSTAVLMMVAAGGLIWANTRNKERAPFNMSQYWYGWPYGAISSHEHVWYVNSADSYKVGAGYFIYVFAICVDVVVALAILFAVWYVSEWWIRRRAGRY